MHRVDYWIALRGVDPQKKNTTTGTVSSPASATCNLPNQFIPTVLGFQNELDNFTHRTGAPIKRGDMVSRTFGIFGSIRNRHRQTNQAHDANVAEVIADETALIYRNICVGNNLFQPNYFVLRILTNIGHL